MSANRDGRWLGVDMARPLIIATSQPGAGDNAPKVAADRELRNREAKPHETKRS